MAYSAAGRSEGIPRRHRQEVKVPECTGNPGGRSPPTAPRCRLLSTVTKNVIFPAFFFHVLVQLNGIMSFLVIQRFAMKIKQKVKCIIIQMLHTSTTSHCYHCSLLNSPKYVKSAQFLPCTVKSFTIIHVWTQKKSQQM